MKRLTDAEARRRVWQYARFVPYADVPYPGSAVGWPGLCTECGNEEVKPSLATIQQGSKGLCKACARSRTNAGVRAKAAGQRLSDDEARIQARDATGFEPYPHLAYVNSWSPWPGPCIDCGTEVRPTLNALKSGKHLGRCKSCAIKQHHRHHTRGQRNTRPGPGRLSDAEARRRAWEYARFVPHAHMPYTKAIDPWPGLCVTCGTVEIAPSLSRLKAGGKAMCASCRREKSVLTDAEARRRALEYSGFVPHAHEPYVNALTPWPGPCIDGCGREVAPRLADLQSGKQTGRCRQCAVGRMRLSEDEARRRAAALGFAPHAEAPYVSFAAPWPGPCVAGCGADAAPSLAALTKGQSSGRCIACRNREIAEAGRKTDADARREALEATGFIPHPHAAYVSSHTPWPGPCLGGCGREVTPTLGNLLSGKQSGKCRLCAAAETSKRLMEERPAHIRDSYIARGLARRTSEAEVLNRVHDVHGDAISLVEYGGTTHATSLWCCTSCDHEWPATAHQIFGRGTGCPECNSPGFKRDAPSSVYLVVSEDLEAIKIGVANDVALSDRLSQHARQTFTTVVKLWRYGTGIEAREVEQAVLKRWRDSGVPHGVNRAAMPYRGHSETAPLSAVSPGSVVSLVNSLRDPVPSIPHEVSA